MIFIEEGSGLVVVGMTNTVIMAVGQGADRATSTRDRSKGGKWGKPAAAPRLSALKFPPPEHSSQKMRSHALAATI